MKTQAVYTTYVTPGPDQSAFNLHNPKSLHGETILFVARLLSNLIIFKT